MSRFHGCWRIIIMRDYMMALGELATGIAGIATAQWEQEAL